MLGYRRVNKVKIKERLIQLAAKALYESVDNATIISFARRIIPDYDIYRSMDISETLSITKRDIAEHLVRDLRDKDLYLDLISLMLLASKDGLNGRLYKFPHLTSILKEIGDSGLIFDWEARMFMEDPAVRRTMNWGILKEDQPYFFTFLRLDIVGNTELVRCNPEVKVKKTYNAIRSFITDIIEARHGRIWRWDGDGALIAFLFQDRYEQSVLGAIEILHWLFVFNHFSNPLDRPVSVRMAVGPGQCHFSMDSEKILHNDMVKRIIQVEAQYTDPDSLTITDEIWQHLEPGLGMKFEARKGQPGLILHNYALRWGDK
jgi:hypothetical protein